MANWLLDYIEMTEYIPSELREQLTSIRELDLQVHNAMDELERDIKQFFSKIDSLSPKERHEQYDQFLKKCDVATKAASDKVKVADKLHELVVKSTRLLDQGLDKLKEDLLEGDKAYIVEDLERRSNELDEQLRLEQETMLQRQKRIQELKSQSRSHSTSNVKISNGKSNAINHHHHHHQTNNHRQPSSQHNNNTSQQHNHHHTNHRNRHNSTGTQVTVGRQKKRERKRLNSTLSIFNRNSMTEDDSTNQTFLSSPMTPDYLNSMQNSNKSMTDFGSGGDLTMKGMLAGNRNSLGINDKSNGNNDPLARARQPILTAIDAAHAVSPNATNSDKLVLFSSNANGDNYNTTSVTTTAPITTFAAVDALNKDSRHPNMNMLPQQCPHNQLSNHLLTSYNNNNSGNNNTLGNNSAISTKNHTADHLHNANHKSTSGPFSSLPLSSRHDPIMVAASQAINATQNMTLGRRTSSLKASYAAVNSGRLQASPSNQQQVFEQQQSGLVGGELYCKCRGAIQDTNMIACDNRNCEIEWFHYQCVGITTPPEGNWYCDECRLLLGSKNNHNDSKQQQQQSQQQSV